MPSVLRSCFHTVALCMCRSTVHPQYLASGYGAPDDHIKTLYDCIETTISRHPEVGWAQYPCGCSTPRTVQCT
jgi:hypothetical protein